MSGGRFGYYDQQLGTELFGYEWRYDYKNSSFVKNTMRDKELSALVADVLLLIHSLDYAESGDTDFDDYKKDCQEFKSKWFEQPREDRFTKIFDDSIGDLRKELLDMIGQDRSG